MAVRFHIIGFIIFLVFTCHPQLNEQQKKWPLDSLLNYAKDESNPIDERLEAFNRSLWKIAYNQPILALKISKEYCQAAKVNNQIERQCKALHFMGNAYMALGIIDSSYWCFNQQYQLSNILKDNDIRNQSINDLGNLSSYKGDFAEALRYFRNSKDLSTKQGDSLNLARAYINIGNIYEKQGGYKESLASYLHAYEISKTKNYQGFWSSIHESLGDIYSSIGEYNRAQQQYDSSLYFAKKTHNVNREIQSNEKIAHLKLNQKEYNSSIEYFNRAISLSKDGSYATHLPRLKAGLAKVWLGKKDIETAQATVEESIQLYEDSEVKMGVQEAYITGGEIYFIQGKHAEAICFLEKGFHIAKSRMDIKALLNSSNLLYQVYKTTNKTKLSLFYLEELNKWSSIQRSRNDLKKILEIELKKEFSDKSFRDSTKHNNEVQILTLEQNKVKSNRFAAYVIILVLVLILVFVYYLFYQKRKNSRMLEKKNKIIKESLEKNETLLKEVRHRVKNNMQMVSSLLHLKEKNVENAIAKESLKDTKLRVDTMITAHQRMYHKDNYDEIEIKGYIHELTSRLLSSYKGENCKLSIEGDEINLELERAQALGFIVHELVTNSFKYAWINKERETIDIGIQANGNSVQITYQDNGPGMPKGFDIAKASSFGLKLVYSMVTRQLSGNIRSEYGKGAKFIIDFKI